MKIKSNFKIISLVISVFFLSIFLPIFLKAETITITDPVKISINELNTKIAQLKIDIAKYKIQGITPLEKIKLVTRINGIRDTAAQLKTKIASMQSSPVVAPSPTVLNPVKPVISISSPTSGVKWYKGSAYSIKFKATEIPNVGITLYRSNGDFASIISSSLTSSSGTTVSYSYSVPGTLYDGDYYLSIYDTRDSSRVWKSGIFNISPKPLEPLPTVTASPSPGVTEPVVPTQIQITSPNGGEKWQQGNTYSIKWNATKAGTSATIAVKNLDNGQVQTYNFSNMQTGNTYSLPITSSLIPGSYKVELTTSENTKDESDNTFFITKPAPKITSVTPSILYPGTSAKLVGEFSTGMNTIYWVNSTTNYPMTPTAQSATQLSFVVPSWAKGVYKITVENEEFTMSEGYNITVNTPSPSPSGSPVSFGEPFVQTASVFETFMNLIDKLFK